MSYVSALCPASTWCAVNCTWHDAGQSACAVNCTSAIRADEQWRDFARTSTLVHCMSLHISLPCAAVLFKLQSPCATPLLMACLCPTAGQSRLRTTSRRVQELYVIRHNHRTGGRTLDLLRWGLISHGCKNPTGGRKPINARAERVASLPTFRGAYAKRRCIVPVESFFEWRAIKGARAKQPYAVAMKDRTPFTIAGLWENWHHPQSGVSSSRDRNSLRIGEVFDLL